jgi:squalene-hopene/tetraprenyl-beta-curcumene cyclase
MVYLQIAFMALGYQRDHAVIQRSEKELDEFFIEVDSRNEIRIQPCFSPVWDTGIALYALTDCGFTSQDVDVEHACEWLRNKECRHVGDWLSNVSEQFQKKDWSKGCGWYFEYHNAWYPDVDDTAMVAMALKRAGGQANADAAKRGVEWLLAMQNDDGGWAAFDKTTHRQILEYIPFADHNAMQDPSCPDITGRVLECLSWHGYRLNHPTVRKAVDYIRKHQVEVDIDDARFTIDDSTKTISNNRAISSPKNTGPHRQSSIHNRQSTAGCFFGRWGVNYIYGTWQAVIGPIRCGVPRTDEWIQRSGRWIKSIQKDDGSFGESANSYEDPSLKGQGPSTASQTAWAAMVLQEIYGPNDPDLKRAIDWLAASQLSKEDAPDATKNPDGDPPGCWVETWFTGTGFPKVFYLRYHLYRMYFPLMAIGDILRLTA